MARLDPIRVRITRDLPKMSREFQRRLQASIRQDMLQAAQLVAGAIREEIAAFTARSPWVKSGQLMRSFKPAIISVNRDMVKVGVFSDLPYAEIQDTGGVIRPKKGKYLAQPLTSRARNLQQPSYWPKGELTFIPAKNTRSGKFALLVTTERKGKSLKRGGKRSKGRKGRFTKITPQYLLRESTTIPKHDYLQKALDVSTPALEDLFTNFIVRELDKDIGDGNV